MKTDNLFDIDGRVAVMTGACGVLGETIAGYFAAQGCKVVLLDLEHTANKGLKIVSEIESGGGAAMFLPTDVLDENVLKANLKTIMDEYGRIDILLNAAGGNMDKANVRPDQGIDELDIDAMKRVCELNIFGTVIPTKVFSKPMIAAGKGSVINFCSMSSFPE